MEENIDKMQKKKKSSLVYVVLMFPCQARYKP